MCNIGIHYIGGGCCGCGSCGCCRNHEMHENRRDCCCLKCRQLDNWFRPACPFGRCGFHNF